MIYFYDVRLRFWINKNFVLKDYLVSFLDLPDFLYYHKNKNSSCEIVFIKAHYSKYKRLAKSC